MSVLNFKDCWARPEKTDGSHLLSSHLKNVAIKAKKNVTNEPTVIQELIYLAALCHDIGKVHKDWQLYIRKKIKQGPNHAECGAFVFSYLAYHYLNQMDVWEKYCREWIWIIRDIADHHGILKATDERDLRWNKLYTWSKMDLTGFKHWLDQQFSGLEHVNLTTDELENWIEEVDEYYEDAVMEGLDPKGLSYQSLMNNLQRWRRLTTALITADRFDVQPIATTKLSSELSERFEEQLLLYCSENAHHPMSEKRQQAQDNIVNLYSHYQDRSIFALSMPTGYGKTLTSFRLATKLGQNSGKEKIIYVAPYLAILEQTTKELEKVFQVNILEHHSLALFDEQVKKASGEKANINDEVEKRSGQLIMESWAHPFVTTSFQQFMKALFPSKAQETLRRDRIQNSVVLIDEPQIFSANVWNLLLVGLQSLVKEENITVIFLSATLPPFEYGLDDQPVLLEVPDDRKLPRYRVSNTNDVNQRSLSERVSDRPEMKKAVIMNTIQDAIDIHKEISSLSSQKESLYLLHGLMVPIHKRIQTEKIKRSLKSDHPSPITVVSTQVLEAGVDASFDYMFRSSTILPSLIQAAGRVNRHGRGTTSLLETGIYLNSNNKDTRDFIYDKQWLKQTDAILEEHPNFTELDSDKLVQEFYNRIFQQNSYEGIKQDIKHAYETNWHFLSQHAPFGDSYMQLPIFISWDFREVESDLLPEVFCKLIDKFQMTSAEDIYTHYQDLEFMHSLSFQDRKEWMMLVYFFVLNLPVKKAIKAVGKDPFLQQRIPFLYDTDAYHHNYGWQNISMAEDGWMI
ncbi:CRISPR-associated helicase Cas3' [Texcoconibacillus texcoconensis]|uniref:CRISPR-associated helicase Cas3/CRISPR-associated endonuclease Cas3-HD n=1 Tax=Texcoconibacillus texcoconensis TaxID=1095777 RepID=A0A840QT09_9BACI|nr:CRISPR-associated helicase Cas3' [Texcoconibacillus texcoconensis]MBB5174421.1 CRISPR-associated helicase Cas3/CRISPR-associated endonuclease Cas3-HD [Texcoconibacillus texcoconensis]